MERFATAGYLEKSQGVNLPYRISRATIKQAHSRYRYQLHIGQMVVKVGMPSLVATIGTQFLWRGVVLTISSGTGFSLISVKDRWLHGMMVGRIGAIPAQFIWTILLAILL